MASESRTSTRKSSKRFLFAENSRLHRSLAGWRALSMIAGMSARGETLESILNEAAREGAKALTADLMAIMLLSEDKCQLDVHASVGLDIENMEQIPILEGESIVEAVRSGLPGWVCPEGVEDSFEEPLQSGAERPGRIIPLVFNQTPVGALCVARNMTKGGFDHEEDNFIKSLASHIATASFINRESRNIAARERIEKDMHFAHSLKAELLPSNFPQIEKMRLGIKTYPCLDGGGDFYDCIELADDKSVVIIGTGSGRAYNGAINAARAITWLRGAFASGFDISEAMQRLNAHLVSRRGRGHVLNLCMIQIAKGDNTLRMVKAGNIDAWQVIKSKIAPLELADTPALGVLDKVKTKTFKVAMKPSSALVIATPGLKNCTDQYGVVLTKNSLTKRFGEYVESLTASTNVPMARHIGDRLRDFTSTDIFEDDVTLLSIECPA